jgi:ubiquinol-cytochrome c reductase cytochrome c1 subunit
MSFKSFLGAALLAAATVVVSLAGEARAAGGGFALDHFPTEKLTDQAALQNGAKVFVNYCLNCHGVSLMRYNRLTDLGLTEKQIKDNLLFTGEKVGDMMKTALNPNDAKAWFGALPPDLSVTARSRSSHDGSGSDWLYTYLRSYYRDNTRATGWNNAVYANVGMPHALWELQGTRGATHEEVHASKNDKGDVIGFAKTTVKFDTAGNRSEQTEKLAVAGGHESSTLTLGKAEGGSISQAQYDDTIADLVAFLTYVADPSAKTRTRVGVWVLLFLGLLCVFTWNLNRVFWKDVK